MGYHTPSAEKSPRCNNPLESLFPTPPPDRPEREEHDRSARDDKPVARRAEATRRCAEGDGACGPERQQDGNRPRRAGEELQLLPESSAKNASSRLSLAGTQNKIGLAHNPNLDFEHGWLRPKGLAATTHLLKTSYLRDLPEIEYLCMSAAAGCGIAVARTHLLALPTPTLAVERFDRNVNVVDGALKVERRHQEDLAQALSLTPGSKYAELPGGSAASIARLIRSKSVRPARDLAQFARTLLFCYAIGNCDAHLKNYSIALKASKRDVEPLIALTPTYDLVSTTRYPRFSRDLAVAIGGVRAIDDVDSAAPANLAKDLGITKAALQGFARDIDDNAVTAIDAAGAGAYGSVLDSTPHVADDLVEEMSPRLEVLEAFCNGSNA